MNDKEKEELKELIAKKDLNTQERALMVAVISLMSTDMGGDLQKNFTPYESAFMLLATEDIAKIGATVEDVLKNALEYALKGVDAQMRSKMKAIEDGKN